MEVRVQHRQHQAQIDRDRGLSSEQHLDSLLDLEVAAVDLVVESDHLVGELGIRLAERIERAAKCAQDEVALLEQIRLGRVQVLLQPDSQPNLPVT
jgi:hypothetical protein